MSKALELLQAGIGTVADLAAQWFVSFNGASSQQRYVKDAASQKFIDEYVAFIERYGSAVFESIAQSQLAGDPAYANNTGFISKLRKHVPSPADPAVLDLRQHLSSLPWLAASPNNTVLIAKAEQCNLQEWVADKASYVDQQRISDAQRVTLFERAIDQALTEQDQKPSGGAF